MALTGGDYKSISNSAPAMGNVAMPISMAHYLDQVQASLQRANTALDAMLGQMPATAQERNEGLLGWAASISRDAELIAERVQEAVDRLGQAL